VPTLDIQLRGNSSCSSLEHFICDLGVRFPCDKEAPRKNIVGKRVAEARNSRNPRLTQDDLSGKLARIGIQLDRAAVAKIENGHRYVLDYELRALSRVLEVEVNWLLGVGER